MKKLILCILLFLVSCGVFTDRTYDVMSETLTDHLTEARWDSLSRADSLPEISDWLYVPAKDYETKKNISVYLYVRETDSATVIYRVQKDSLYNVSKREMK